jgi:hypothetical protein
MNVEEWFAFILRVFENDTFSNCPKCVILKNPENISGGEE